MSFFSYFRKQPSTLPETESSLKDTPATENNLKGTPATTTSNSKVTQGRKNIVVFGETDAGKSSIIHLLTKAPPTQVSNQEVDCTFQSQKYEYGDFDVYETRSATNGSTGRVSPVDAIRNLVSLLKSLEDGINLLVFVFRKDRIKETTEQHYNLIANGICQGVVPVILILTNCEMDNCMESWWRENKIHFDGYGFNFLDVICGTAAHPDDHLQFLRPSIEERREETRCRLEESLRKNSLPNPWKMDAWVNWIQAAVRRVWNIICPLKIVDIVPNLREILILHGNLSEEEANALANEIIAIE